eukprot:6037179-Prorocentrum_lima.AAC.1
MARPLPRKQQWYGRALAALCGVVEGGFCSFALRVLACCHSDQPSTRGCFCGWLHDKNTHKEHGSGQDFIVDHRQAVA